MVIMGPVKDFYVYMYFAYIQYKLQYTKDIYIYIIYIYNMP